MNDILEKLERVRPYANILVACRLDSGRRSIIEVILDSEANVVGPVETTSLALQLAAQTPIDLAIVETELAGLRNGFVLAERLEEDWGVHSLLMGERAAPSNKSIQTQKNPSDGPQRVGPGHEHVTSASRTSPARPVGTPPDPG